jgi:hypothetical protein
MPRVYDWSKCRAELISSFEGMPIRDQEERVLKAFEMSPEVLMKEARRLAERFRAGQIRACWVILASYADAMNSPARQAIVTDQRSRDEKTAQARQWIKTFGRGVLTENELCHELFDIRGKTASLDFLERFEADNRDAPSRHLWIRQLQSQIERTRTHGRDEVQGNPAALLRPWAKDAQLIAEMVSLWEDEVRRESPAGSD